MKLRGFPTDGTPSLSFLGSPQGGIIGGIPGPPGDQGPQGDPGPAGPANTLTIGTVAGGVAADATITGTPPNQTLNLTLPKGDGLRLDTVVATYAALPTGLGAGDNGYAAYVQADGRLYLWSGTAWPANGAGALIRGPQGDQGPQGDPGAPGADGADGADGAPGAPGAPGADGADGSDGAPGADGASAYEVAVANGFIGTQAQWLTSLIGPQGPQGPQGPPGTGGGGGPGYFQFIGAVAANSSVIINHGLNTLALHEPVMRRTFLLSGALGGASPNDHVPVKWRYVDENNIALEFADPAAANEYAITITPANVTMDTTGPGAGVLSSPSQTTTTVDLSLAGGTDAETPLGGVSWYRVIGGVDTLIGQTPGDTFTATGLSANTSYSFKAVRFNLLGKGGTVSNTLVVSTSVSVTPPAFDSSSISAQSAAASNSLALSWSHTVGSGTSMAAIVAVPVSNSGSGGFVVTGTPTCTIGGQSLTYKGVQLMGNASNAGWVAVFAGTISAGAGARTVNVSIACAGQTLANSYGTCFTYSGVSSIGSLVTAQGTTSANAVTVSSALTHTVWGLFGNYQTGTYSSLSFTSRRSNTANFPYFVGGDQAGASSVNFAATESSTFHWAGVCLDLTP